MDQEHLIENLSDGASSPLSWCGGYDSGGSKICATFSLRINFSHSIELSPFTVAELRLTLRVFTGGVDPEVFLKKY